MKRKILVIGSLNMDMVLEVQEFPKSGETILASQLKYNLGGKGANQACAVGRLGGSIQMLGCIGNDDYGNIQKKELSLSHVDVSQLKIRNDSPTGMAVINVNEAGNNTIVVVQGANATCDISYLKEMDSLIQNCDYMLLQMEIPEDALYYAIARGKELGKCVVLNPAPAPDNIPKEVLRDIDYLTPNETELIKLSGQTEVTNENILLGAKKLVKDGVKNILVTMGENGVLKVDESGEKQYPAQKVKVVDTTAAGDCFNGAFVLALSEGKSEAEAITFANKAAGIAVTRMGAQNSIPYRKEITID